MVLVRRPMPGITMEQLLLPVLPSRKNSLFHLQTKSAYPPARSLWSRSSGLQEAQKGGK